jgi:hypothetical protein
MAADTGQRFVKCVTFAKGALRLLSLVHAALRLCFFASLALSRSGCKPDNAQPFLKPVHPQRAERFNRHVGCDPETIAATTLAAPQAIPQPAGPCAALMNKRACALGLTTGKPSGDTSLMPSQARAADTFAAPGIQSCVA